MAKLSFSAQVKAWADKVPEAVEAVWKESTKEVVKDMQRLTTEGGRMRFKTGFLQSSLLSSTTAMPTIDQNALPAPNATYVWDADVVEAVINSAEIGQTIFLGYTAAYAAFREYGANGHPPDGFVRLAVQNWAGIVDKNAKKVKEEFGLS